MTIYNDVFGRPGDGGPEAVRQRNESLWKEAEFIEQYRRRKPPTPYYQTHGPWEIARDLCATCGKTRAEIHMDKLVCL